MKKIFAAAILLAVFNSCTHKNKAVVDAAFVDSLLLDPTVSSAQNLNEQNLAFWKTRAERSPLAYTEMQQYAGTLAGRFQLYGDINDLVMADSILHSLNNIFKEKDAGIARSLAVHAITRHRFHDASGYIQQALSIGSEKYISGLLNFDIAFELGNMRLAKDILKKIKATNEYGYFFRLSKYDHMNGELDSSIEAMNKATGLAGNNNALKQTAVSNTADLYMHAADPARANELYMQSLRLDASDMHSLAGIGWIALVYDKKDMLAEKIFRFIHSKTKSPDILLKLAYVAEQRNDSMIEKKYADEFVKITSDTIYGNMYNKYLVDLYTNFLNEPAKAVAIAERELTNRATPQTYSWYVWSLFKNGQKDNALKVYDEYVSGKPLEGLELYYMGMMMKEMNKGYNAKQYFKVAYKNRYDLSPAKQKELEDILEN